MSKVTVYKLSNQLILSNSYLVTADGENAVVIDPSSTRIFKEAQEKGLKIVAALLTHGHFDHVGGCFALNEADIPVYCAAAEDKLVHGTDSQYLYWYGAPAPTFKTQSLLRDNDKITLAGVLIEVIATPGHTAGGLTYRVGNNLFTGDTLFKENVGRTDFPTGSWDELVKSVKKLYALPGDFCVYTGHGEETTLEHERKYNPYVSV